jgi:hypothetical protein
MTWHSGCLQKEIREGSKIERRLTSCLGAGYGLRSESRRVQEEQEKKIFKPWLVRSYFQVILIVSDEPADAPTPYGVTYKTPHNVTNSPPPDNALSPQSSFCSLPFVNTSGTYQLGICHFSSTQLRQNFSSPAYAVS